MLFEDSYRPLFHLYCIFGMAPSSNFFNLNKTSANSMRKLWQFLWFICVLLFEFYILIVCLEKRQKKLMQKINLYTVNSALTEIANYVLIITVTIESFCQRNAQVQILRNLNEIDLCFATKLKWKVNYNELRRLIRIAFFKWILFYVVADIAILYFYSDARTYYTVYEMLKKIIFASKFIIFAILIKYRIEAMHRVLFGERKWARLKTFFRVFSSNPSTKVEAIELQRMIDL